MFRKNTIFNEYPVSKQEKHLGEVIIKNKEGKMGKRREKRKKVIKEK